MTLCTAKTQKGLQCKNEATNGKLCAFHVGLGRTKQSFLERYGKKVITAGELASAAAGFYELIKVCVELWQKLPFGPAPTPPREFRELQSFFPPGWPTLPKSYTPFNKSHEQMDWGELLDIHKRTKEIRNADDLMKLADRLEHWFLGRPEPYQLMLNNDLAESQELR